ncbi:UNVERIFIED_CONTAM: hypothetical protein GTU68_036892, partial [Idotea baltica]|nr:hypothetical protein [Idotea baltica]
LTGATYVDHAASTLYSEKQLESVFSTLKSTILGNPHSRHLPSDTTTEAIESARNRVLNHFKTNNEEYDMIFTSGATEAIKIVANCFQWTKNERKNQGTFIYTQDNHTSILGMRESAHKNGAKVVCLPINTIDETLCGEKNEDQLDITDVDNCLFAYPAQCNYSGTKYPLSWVDKVQKGGLKSKTMKKKWFVLLDAASFVATSPLDLSRYKPDFVPISFYKMMGYPTGLGCLLVHKRAWPLLHKPYFGGGTVQMVDSRNMTVERRITLHQRFEDGTLPFSDIVSLQHGFNTLNRITGGMANVEEHVFNVARYLLYNLISLKHENNCRVAEVYCQAPPLSVRDHGPIVNFNVLDSLGAYVGYSQVEKVSSLYNIYLRTGCVCNPGACQRYLNISSTQLKKQFDAGHVCGDANDLVEGQPTGSVRVSFGYMSDYEEADAVLNMIKECFVEGSLRIDSSWLTRKESLKHETADHKAVINGLESREEPKSPHRDDSTAVEEGGCRLTDIIVYPVKSCAGISAERWPVGLTGLQFDRRWMIVTSSGVTLTQKRMAKLSLLKPAIDWEANLLTLSYQGGFLFVLFKLTKVIMLMLSSKYVNVSSGRKFNYFFICLKESKDLCSIS